jgi:hypothetical protein
MALKLLTIVFALFALAPAPASVGERYYEPAGGFSICPPAGWEVRAVQGQEYKIMLLTSGETRANVIVKGMDFGGPLEEFMSRNLLGLTQLSEEGKLKRYRLLGRSELKTDAGARVLKAVIEQEIVGHLLRQTFYAFDAGAGRKIYLTSTVPSEAGEEYDKAVEESARTFRLEGPPAPPKP